MTCLATGNHYLNFLLKLQLSARPHPPQIVAVAWRPTVHTRCAFCQIFTPVRNLRSAPKTFACSPTVGAQFARRTHHWVPVSMQTCSRLCERTPSSLPHCLLVAHSYVSLRSAVVVQRSRPALIPLIRRCCTTACTTHRHPAYAPRIVLQYNFHNLPRASSHYHTPLPPFHIARPHHNRTNSNPTDNLERPRPDRPDADTTTHIQTTAPLLHHPVLRTSVDCENVAPYGHK